VHLDEPGWWYGEARDARLRLLRPLSRLYGFLVQSRFRRRQPYRSRFPVICVGNFTAGGTGKTPLAILIARLLQADGAKPVFLTRGYGGIEPGPVWVEVGASDAARRFGDEPLLLARIAPTLVARDRREGVLMLETGGHSLSAVIMDDGLQNPALVKDLSLAVVDGVRGLGNGEVMPAGPLRAPIEFQLGLVDAIVVREPQNGAEEQGDGIHVLLQQRFPGPVLAAHVVARGETAWLAGAPVVAFAGIVHPDRFFSLLERLGARLVVRVPFPDHHVFSRADADRLLSLAEENGAHLVTTEKDLARLAGGRLSGALLERTRALAIDMALEERDLKRLSSLIEAATQQQGYPRRVVRPPQL